MTQYIRQLRTRARRLRWPSPRLARGNSVVLLYHRVQTTTHSDPTGMSVGVDTFRSHLSALRDAYDVVPAHSIRRPTGRPTVAITFDDGYADNVEVAVPLLREAGLPATFFVVTDTFSDDEEYWWDQVEHLVMHRLPPEPVSFRVGGRTIRLGLGEADGRARGLLALTERMMMQPPAALPGTLDALYALADSGRLPVPCDRHRRMSADAVAAVAADDQFDIGSHTCSHGTLGRMAKAERRREVQVSRTVLSDIIGWPPRLLAYPYGAPGTISRMDARLARDAGYESAFVNVAGPVEGAAPHAVPRITVGEWSADSLRRRMHRWMR